MRRTDLRSGFGYRDAATFWDLSDPRLALLVHSVVGGTPAYRREFVTGDSPASLADFEPWVLRTVLNPQLPIFREARYLLAEEGDIRDTAIDHAVLGAIASGNATRGGIASHIGRKSPAIGHPLAVLEDSQLITRETDPFRKGRSLYRITEPTRSAAARSRLMWPFSRPTVRGARAGYCRSARPNGTR